MTFVENIFVEEKKEILYKQNIEQLKLKRKNKKKHSGKA
jgi:hypothetical protein